MLHVETFKVGRLKTNCYLLCDKDTKKFAIIDPGDLSFELMNRIYEIKEFTVEYILLTHGHVDHIGSAECLRKLLGARIVIGHSEAEFLRNNKLNLSDKFMEGGLKAFEPDLKVKDLDVIPLGSEKIKVMETPGHTLNSVCYITSDKIFSGDTFMSCHIGRSDFPTGDFKTLMNSIKKISNIKGDYKVYPGHGRSSTLNFEKENNVYFRKAMYEN